MSLTYTDQKSCIKGKQVTHIPSGDAQICPVRALERIVTHLLLARAPLDCPLHAYYERGKRKHITTTTVTTHLRAAAVENITGTPPSLISMRSLRPGGATALLCSGEEPTGIALVGRWRSDAMLRYLRANTTPGAKVFAQKMLQFGTFSYTPNTSLPGSTDYFGVPNELPAAIREQFDPSDDASDDEADT